MIPYFEQPSIHILGPISIHAFGVLLALALVLGIRGFMQRVRARGLDVQRAERLATALVFGGLVGAHLVDRVFYEFRDTLAQPWTLLMPWRGMSSYGGFFGGMAGAWWVLRSRPAEEVWRYVDAAAAVVPVGWCVGRLGCFLAFDHVGIPTTSWIGQRYADGLVRHNLGLEEAIFWAFMIPVVHVLEQRPLTPGMTAGVIALLYAPVRFGLDFLRVGDAGLGGLIVSQYASIIMFMAGVGVVASALVRTPPGMNGHTISGGGTA